MKIAVIDHAFHKKTQSSSFFYDLLSQIGSIDTFWEELWWDGSGLMNVEPILDGNYDLIICFQTEFHVPALLKYHSNVVTVPMYDGAVGWDQSFWKQCMRGRIISFSRTLHDKLQNWGCDSYHVQYAPDPSKFQMVEDFSDLRAFFWERVPESDLNASYVIEMLSYTKANSLHIHQAPDTGVKSTIPNSNDPLQVTTSTWFEEVKDYLDIVQNSNVFIQPRIREGIGMAFLEAMAMGQCVLSPGYATMNEYITNSVNGLLFDPTGMPQFSLLTPKFAKTVGLNARLKIENTHEKWLRDETRIVELLSNPKGHRKFKEGFSFERAQKKPAVQTGSRPKRKPGAVKIEKNRITIACITYNVEEDLQHTLDFISKINYPNLELLIVDGASTDGTKEIIKKNSSKIEYWLSEPDLGTYDAMNKAADIASGEYILFLNVGDELLDGDCLQRVMKVANNSEERPDIIYGHHYWHRLNGTVEHRPANSFHETWGRLQGGHLDLKWLEGIPCHQATLTRTEYLREHKYNVSFHIAADHEFLFRARALEANFLHSCETICVYYEGGLSSDNSSRLNVEWYNIAKNYSINPNIDKFYYNAIGFTHMDYLHRTLNSGEPSTAQNTPFKIKVAQALRPYPAAFETARRVYGIFKK